MATNEEGEFELVLGSKQLLSVFFIVVVLLGVFFTMGYIVARSMAPKTVDVAVGAESDPPVVVEPPSGPVSEGRPSPAGEVKQPETPAPEPTRTETPTAEPPKAEPVKPDPPPVVPPVKPSPVAVPKSAPPEPKPTPPVKPIPAPVKPAPPAPSAAIKGTYFQVSAIEKKEAEMLAEVLRKKGFHATTQAVPDRALVRVLVGPVKDSEEMNKVKAGLVAAGFQPIPKKL